MMSSRKCCAKLGVRHFVGAPALEEVKNECAIIAYISLVMLVPVQVERLRDWHQKIDRQRVLVHYVQVNGE
jgi:hypothetical protein